MKTIYRILSVSVFLTSIQAFAQFGDFPPADRALGALDLTSQGVGTLNANGLDNPRALAIDPGSGKLFVVDANRHRILRFASAAGLGTGALAEGVIGQAAFNTSASALSQSGLNSPLGICVDAAGNLWVADSGNQRVLRFPNAANAANGVSADLVLGQMDFTSNASGSGAAAMDTPSAVFVDTLGNLWVAETNNHRVTRFANATAIAVNGTAAVGVLGQTAFGLSGASSLANGFDIPIAITGDSGGRLWVASLFNNRVFRFDNAAVIPDGSNATAVIGQSALNANASGLDQSSLNFPFGIALSASGTLFVSDGNNRRILSFPNAATLPNGASAANVIGQANFTSNTTGLSERRVGNTDMGIVLDNAGNLWVSDSNNDRVLRFSPDTVKPVLSVTSRLPRKTKLARVTVRGTATDASLLRSVRFKAGAGGFRNAIGTNAWRFTARLKTGRNTISIIATDTADNVSLTKTLRTTRAKR